MAELPSQVVTELATYNIREKGYLTFATDDEDEYLTEIDRRREAGQRNGRDFHTEGPSPAEVVKRRGEEAKIQRDGMATREKLAKQREVEVEVRAGELAADPQLAASVLAKVERHVTRGLPEEPTNG